MKCKWVRDLTLCGIIGLQLMQVVPVYAIEFKSVNNEAIDNSDLKLTDSQITDFGLKYTPEKYFYGLQNRNLESLSAKENWLVTNQILARDMIVSISENGISSKIGGTFDINRSSLYMAAYKAEKGVLNSRNLIKSVPILDEDENIVDYRIDSYVNPNVRELYLERLISDGIVNRDDISNDKFLDEMNNNGKSNDGNTYVSRWNSQISDYAPLDEKYLNKDGRKYIVNSTVFGQSWRMSDTSGISGIEDKTMGKLVFSYAPVEYFKEETISKNDAFNIIASIMRVYEKDMTNTEAQIVSYKYGVDILDNFPSEDANTIAYLIAMGILNPENKEEFLDIYEDIDKNTFVLLLYRLANKSGRFDFSKIQLTDSDNFWLSKGYREQNVNIYDADYASGVETVSVSEISETSFKKVDKPSAVNIFKMSKVPQLKTLAAKEKDYKVVKKFPADYQGAILYKGKELKKGANVDGVSKIEIEKDTGYVSNGTKEFMKVTFSVKATSQELAVKMVDMGLSVDTKSNKNVSVISSVGTVTSVDGLTLVPQSALKTSNININVIEDKVLMNKSTGATAMLLPDSGYAIVGNEFIKMKGDEMQAKSLAGEIYYNMNIISRLMSYAAISTLDSKSMFVQNSKRDGIKTVRGNTGLALGKTYHQSNGSIHMYSVTHLVRGQNTVILNLDGSSRNDEGKYSRAVINWQYITPSASTEYKGQLSANGTVTLADMNKFLYNRPSDADLAKFWDSNIMLTDAIMNGYLGTTGVNYAKCGYLAPSITILDSTGNIDNAVNTFKSIAKPSSNELAKYGASAEDWLDKMFNQTSSGNTYESLSQSRKFLKYTADAKKDSSINFTNQYVMTSSLQIYKACDDTVKYSNNEFKLKTRNIGGMDYVWDMSRMPSSVKFAGSDWIVAGFGSNYVRLISANPMNGTLVKNGGIYSIQDSKLNDLFTETKNKISFTYLKDGKKASDLFIDFDDKVKQRKAPYNAKEPYIDGKKVVGINKLNRTKANGYYNIYLDRNKWYLNEDTGEVEIRNTLPYLEQGNIMISSMTSGIIDSILYNNYGVKKLNELPTGSRVVMGDIVAKVGSTDKDKNVYVNTLPITDGNLIASLKTLTDEQQQKETMVNYFRGLGIQLKLSGLTMDMSELIHGYDLGTAESTDGLNILMSGRKIKKSDGTTVNYNTDYNAVVAKYLLDGNLVFRPSGEDGEYLLVQVSEQYSEGFTGGLPFFKEKLYINRGSGGFYEAGTYKFKVFGRFGEVMKEFLNDYDNLLKENFSKLISIGLIYFIFAIIVLSWILFGILTLGTFRNAIYIIRDGTARGYGGNGLDLVKLFTFGLYTVDSRISANKLVISNVLLFTLMFFVYKLGVIS